MKKNVDKILKNGMRKKENNLNSLFKVIDELIKACDEKDNLLNSHVDQIVSEQELVIAERNYLKKLSNVKDILANITHMHTEEEITINTLINNFYKKYESDGDLLRCRECGRAIIASRMHEQLIHKRNCKNGETINPWLKLRIYLTAL